MKAYEVELKRVSYVIVTVEADTPEAAEKAAWLELENGDYPDKYAEWSLEAIDQMVTG